MFGPTGSVAGGENPAFSRAPELLLPGDEFSTPNVESSTVCLARRCYYNFGGTDGNLGMYSKSFGKW